MPREKNKNIMRKAEEKEKLVLEYCNSNLGFRKFAEQYDIHPFTFHKWIEKYESDGLEALKSKTGKYKGENKGKGKKKLKTREEELERELFRKDVEIARLKKGYLVKGVGQEKEYVSINIKNIE